MGKGYPDFLKSLDKEKIREYIKISYKKLKNNIFFDKTAVVTRNLLVEYENESKGTFDNKLEELADSLFDENKWQKKEEEILASIEVLTLPKKISNNKKNPQEQNLIFNKNLNENIDIEDFQYMIEMNIEGHILGVLWILLIGRYLDEDSEMYRHSYANRLRKDLFKDGKEPTYYPGLFEPYFSQYTTWRDKGIKIAQEQLAQGSDVIILTMDLMRYYYSVNYTEDEFNYILDKLEVNKSEQNSNHFNCLNYLHRFIYNVIFNYSNKIRKCCSDEELWSIEIDKKGYPNNVLPIGFLPSNILSNHRLNIFDKHVNTRWNPLYYGRYVDDIIIVDKVEKHSALYEAIYDSKTDVNRVIELYLQNCNATKCNACVDEKSRSLLRKNTDDKDTDGNVKDYYYINPELFKITINTTDNNEETTLQLNKSVRIKIQSKKVRLFAFNAEASDRLLVCFKNEILKNSSEFRLLPNAGTLYKYNEYSKIFNVNYADTINKLSSVQDISVDRFELSKFLGKQMAINMLAKIKENTNLDELLKLMSDDVLVANYLLWERVLEILILRKSYERIIELADNILLALGRLNLSREGLHHDKIKDCQTTLFKIFYSDLCRVMSLVWGKKITECINQLSICIEDRHINDNIYFKENKINILRERYCLTRMLNKYLVPLCMEGIIDNLMSRFSVDDNQSLELFDFDSNLHLISSDGLSKSYYYYCPTVITPHELNFTISTASIIFKDCINDVKINDNVNTYYALLNYHYTGDNSNTTYGGDKIEEVIRVLDSYDTKNLKQNLRRSCVCVKNKEKLNLRIALANTKMQVNNFIGMLTGFPNRSLVRYEQLEKIMYEAVKQKVDLIVFPESYLPYEWISRLTRFSAANRIGIITGIEHLLVKKENNNDIKSASDDFKEKIIFNLTAVILPYEINSYNYAHLSIHEKVHLSPEEKRKIKGYSHCEHEGKTLHMFYWHDVWFSVHCCFELASIDVRSAFKNYVDLIIAVVWNRDIHYFSNIIESLCRDMHCYCMQVNSSDYGDSRLVQPAKSASMDIMRVSGGINDAILVEDLDVGALRKFQRKEYELQHDDKQFKPTPPGFNTGIVDAKMHKKLAEIVKKDFEN